MTEKKFRQRRLSAYSVSVDKLEDTIKKEFDSDFDHYINPIIVPFVEDAFDDLDLDGIILKIDTEEIEKAEKLYQLLIHPELVKEGLDIAYLNCLDGYGDKGLCKKIKKDKKVRLRKSIFTTSGMTAKNDQMLNRINIDIEEAKHSFIDNEVSNIVENRHRYENKTEDIYDEMIQEEEDQDVQDEAEKSLDWSAMRDLYSDVINDRCIDNKTGKLRVDCYLFARDMMNTDFKENEDRKNRQLVWSTIPLVMASAKIKNTNARVVARRINQKLVDDKFYATIAGDVEQLCNKALSSYQCNRILPNLKKKRYRSVMLHVEPSDILTSAFLTWKSGGLLQRIRDNSDITVADVEHTDELSNKDISDIRELCDKVQSPICDELEWHIGEDQYLHLKKQKGDSKTEYYYEKCYPLVESEEFIRDGVKICPKVQVDLSGPTIKNSIELRNNSGDSGIIDCIHTAVMDMSAEQYENFGKEGEREIIEHVKSTEGRPIAFEKLYPKQHFFSLNSVVEGWLDAGLKNIFNATYEGYASNERPFGFNSLMESQMIKALTTVSKEGTKDIIKGIFRQAMKNDPQWASEHAPALFDKYDDYISKLLNPDDIEGNNTFKNEVIDIFGLNNTKFMLEAFNKLERNRSRSLFTDESDDYEEEVEEEKEE